ncbi:MAG: hypothetical protein WDN28_32395 [Chthoniobacter sp.]
MDKPKASAAVRAAKLARPEDALKTVINGASPSPEERDRALEILEAMLALRNGNFAARLPAGWTGVHGKIADAFNDVASMNKRRADETTRICRVVGKEGKLKQRIRVPGLVGGWGDEVEMLNGLVDDLVWPVTEVTRTIGAVAKGDLSESMALDVDGRRLEGEFLHSAKLVNRMIDQLSVFTSEVTRVAREVGTEGKLGGQAQVKNVSGAWKELTESVNLMAVNLTAQVRNIVDVTIAVAQWRPFQEDHRGRARRDFAAQGSNQHHGRSIAFLRFRSDARRARSRHRRTTRRAGGGPRRGGHMEGSDRLGERHGVEPYRPGPKYRGRDHCRGARRPFPAKSRSR